MRNHLEARPDLLLWEALDPDDAAVEQARRLYETTQALDEQIPWKWIAAAVVARKSWRPGSWSPHLLLAAARAGKKSHRPVSGFAYAIHLPGYGGYLTYLGVDPRERGRGIGTRLIELSARVLQVDACCEGVSLPFVVWESRPPAADDEAGRRAWEARLGLFRRAGGWWVSGLTLHAVNYNRRQAEPLPLQLFLLPVDRPAEGFDDAALRGVAGGLLREVYGRRPGDPYHDRTLPPGCRPMLRPVAEALALTAGLSAPATNRDNAPHP